ncbi:MAG TPA: PQQ-binding-like beta-propeller repeat protein [Candidatus Cloacimonas sp.]|nr:PQQ-binding-like beta-propeller repeat protein [Candidatus Cloacimonas sp.]
MISLQSLQASPPRSICEYKTTKDGHFAWFLLTWHPEKDNVLEEIVAEIKLEVLNSKVSTLSRLEVEKWLKQFFSELHWKLYGILRKTQLQEKGISLFFGVLFDNELYFVQFGRIFCVLADSKKIAPVGRDWKNFQVQSLEGMQLLGLNAQDISIKPRRVYIDSKQHLIVLSGELAHTVFNSVNEPAAIDTLLETYATEDNPLWLILEGKEELTKQKRRKLSRLQVTSIILIALALLAALYMMLGNRILDQMIHKTRLSIKEENILRLEQIPANLNITSENLKKYMDKLVNMPARNISLRIAWSTELPYDVSLSPSFSLSTIYLVSHNRLSAYDKKSRQLLWSKLLADEIRTTTIHQGVLIVYLANQQILGLNDDGQQLWQQHLPTESITGDRFIPCIIKNSDDPRLDRSIIVIPSKRGISILDPVRGETLSSLTLKQDLNALSVYDSFTNCFYAVVDDAVLCIELKIVN